MGDVPTKRSDARMSWPRGFVTLFSHGERLLVVTSFSVGKGLVLLGLNMRPLNCSIVEEIKCSCGCWVLGIGSFIRNNIRVTWPYMVLSASCTRSYQSLQRIGETARDETDCEYEEYEYQIQIRNHFIH